MKKKHAPGLYPSLQQQQRLYIFIEVQPGGEFKQGCTVCALSKIIRLDMDVRSKGNVFNRGSLVALRRGVSFKFRGNGTTRNNISCVPLPRPHFRLSISSAASPERFIQLLIVLVDWILQSAQHNPECTPLALCPFDLSIWWLNELILQGEITTLHNVIGEHVVLYPCQSGNHVLLSPDEVARPLSFLKKESSTNLYYVCNSC